MPGLVPGIHEFGTTTIEGVDGRDKPGHDESGCGLGAGQCYSGMRMPNTMIRMSQAKAITVG